MADLDPAVFGPDSPCFGCSPGHRSGLRLTFEHVGDEVVSRFTPREDHQGPPNIMHGGLVTTVADEVAAWTIIGILGKFGFTADLSAKFVKPVRTGVATVARGRIEKASHRVVRVSVTMTQEEVACFSGNFTFALLDQGAAEKMLGRSLPDLWKQYTR